MYGGDINKSQFNAPPVIRQEQGVIKLINGGKISYAKDAIETIKYSNKQPDLTTSGGIILIRDGAIENCKRGVVFYPYENFYPDKSKPKSNWSNFNKARFYNYSEVLNDAQMYLNGVSGIQIQGSSFENFSLHSDFITSYGIKSFNSSFSVSKIDLSPIPNGGSIPSSFIGFEYGIHASAGRMLSGIIGIRSTSFKDNLTSIYISAIENSIISLNEFNVRDYNSKFNHTNHDYVGLYLDNYTTGFTVEENRFYSNLANGSLEINRCVGIVVNNSGENPNELYNNTIDKLTIGIEAVGNNRDITGAGLCIKCNDFTNCKNDIYVTPEIIDGKLLTGSTIGIAETQGEIGNGDPKKPAGNTFSVNEIITNVNNEYCQRFSYVHHLETDENVRPDIFTNIVVEEDVTSNYNKESACPSHIGGDPHIIMEKSILSLESNQILHYSDTLKSKIDGGNSTQLVWEVLSAMPQETLQIHNKLLNKSPFLSDTVMKSVIENENTIPNAIVRDVLIANPQSGRSIDIINRLKSRLNPMPEYMIDEIILGSNGLGAKEILERKLNLHKIKYNKSLHTIETYYKSDTTDITTSQDSLKILWLNQPFLESKFKLAFLQLLKNNLPEVDNVLSSVIIEFELSPKEVIIYSSYIDLFNILLQIENDSVGIDSTKITSLINLAENYNNPAGIYAMNILMNEGKIEYKEPLFFPDYSKSSLIPLDDYKHCDESMVVTFYPNPAKDFVIVESTKKGEVEFTINDMYGRQLLSLELTKIESQKVISLSHFKSGVYVVKFIENGKLINSKKLIIVQ